MKTSAAKASGGYHFLISDSGDDFNNGFSLVIDSGNRPSFVVAKEGLFGIVTRASATSATTVAPNTTHYVAGTYDGSRARIYVDGVERASATFSGSPTWASGRDLRLGRPISSTSLGPALPAGHARRAGDLHLGARRRRRCSRTTKPANRRPLAWAKALPRPAR